MLKRYIFGRKRESNRLLVLFFTITACVALAFYVGFIIGEGIVCTHGFYIPIILAGVWYYKKAIYVALFLSIANILVTHLSAQVVTIDNFARCVVLIATAYVIGVISEKRAKGEGALRETRNYLENLINCANAPIIVWNPKFRITRFNHAFEHLTSYTADEVIGQELSILFPEASREGSLSKIERALSSEYWKSIEIPILGKDGDIRIALWNSANIYAKDDKTLLATIAQSTDITERKRAKDALAASKAYTESIIQNFLDTLIVVNAEAKIQTVNPETCYLLGYTKEELIGQPVSIIFAEEEEEEEVYRVFQFLRDPENKEVLRPQDTIRNHELTYKTKDGRLIPMSFNASVLTDEAGKVAGVVAGAKDITKLKLAEAEIRKEKNFSENIIATIPDSLLVLDKDLRVKSANRTFYETFQTESEKVIGRNITDILGDGDGRLSTELTRLFGIKDTLEGFELHYQLEKLGERMFNIRARGIIVAEEEEEEEELIIIEDITQRKRAEEELKQYEFMVESAHDAIFFKDLKGRYIIANKKTLEAFGLSHKEVIGKNDYEIMSNKEEAKKNIEDDRVVFQEGKLTEITKRMTGADGKGRWFQAVKVPQFNHEGQVIGLVGIARDITQRKKTEEALLRSERLKVLGEMAAGVAHDFNNLLAVILGNAQLLERGIRRYKLEEIKERLRVIARTAYEGGETVRRLQHFTHREVPIYDFTKIDLNEIVRDAIASTSPRWKDEAEAKGVTVKIKEKLEKLPPLLGSRSGLMEVLTNLIFNALEAMPEGGEITIKTEAKENKIYLYFTDNGKGIPDRIKEKIFDPFFTTKGPQSSGLGLSVSYGIIKRHKGEIRVDSIKGKGTTFTISIPINLEVFLKEEKLEDVEKISSRRILIIDDEEGVRDVLGRIFQDEGHQVILAETGRKGLVKFKQSNFDLVLTDLGMPEMSGWELAKKIKKINPGVPVGLITGWPVTTTEEKIKDEGIDFILSKPFDYAEVLREVNALLKSKKR